MTLSEDERQEESNAQSPMAAPRKASEEWKPEHASNFEPMFAEVTCSPILPLLPPWVTPNAITMTNLYNVIFGTALALIALEFTSFTSLMCRFVVGGCIFASAVLDCLDGEWARASKQSSKFGEVLDHWVDSWCIPMTSLAICVCACVDNVMLACAMTFVLVTYNSQVKLYYLTGEFVMPEHSGSLGQCVGSAFIIIISLVTYGFGRTHWFTATFRTISTLLFTVGNFQNVFFYVKQSLRRKRVADMLGVCGALHLGLLVASGVFLAQNDVFNPWHGTLVLRDSWPLPAQGGTVWMTPLAFNVFVVASSGLSSGTTVVCAVSKSEFVSELPILFIALSFLAGHIATLMGLIGTDSMLLAVLPYAGSFVMYLLSVHHLYRMKRKVVKSA